jgi:hypothetical protein
MSAPIKTGYEPHKYQKEIHAALSLHRFAVLVCHRRFGKTILAVNALIDAALRCDKPDGRYAYVAPYLKQAKQIAWLYLCRFGLPVPGTRKQEAELFLELPNGARITLFGADNAEAMRGIYLDGVVLDEMADFKPYVWGEIIRPALSDRKGWALFIGTPKGVNQFHDLYEAAQRDPLWYAGIYRADETDLPWLDAEELELARGTMTPAQFRQEFLCDFSAAVDNALIAIDEVSAAMARSIRPGAIEHAPRILGVDVARFGGDRSAICKRQGIYLHAPVSYQGIDNMELADRVAYEIVHWKPRAVFIDGGRGEGVIDRLRQLGHTVTEVNFGGASASPRYKNKRAEMWDSLAQWIRDGGAIEPSKSLKSDLCVPLYSFDSAQRMVLESKDDIKKRGMRSPDEADAAVLTFAMPVAMPMDAFTRRLADAGPATVLGAWNKHWSDE